MQNKYGETALFGACQQGQAETARVLVDHGANVDYKNKVKRKNIKTVATISQVSFIYLFSQLNSCQ